MAARRRLWPPAFAAALLAALLWAWAAEALAHRVSVFAVAQGGVISGEGYYANGTKAQGALVELRDASGALAAQTRTRPDGTFSLDVPQGATPPLTVVLKAGDGHQSDYTLTAKDLGQGVAASPSAPPASASPPDAAPAAAPAQAPAPAPLQASAQASAQAPALDEARLQALVEQAAAKALEGQLAPLRLELARLAAQAEGNRLRDIVGGLGWIMGLAGLAAWFKRKR